MLFSMLTPKQKRILEFISSFREAKGYSPSQHEIARHFGFKSLGTVQNYLVRLERQGLLSKTWNARRGVLPPAPQPPVSIAGVVPLPLSGRVAAGRPIEAVLSQESIDIPMSMLDKRHIHEHFVLKVKGDSMIDSGILDGDYVVIRKKATAENGDTVVALVDGEATIKKFQRKAGHVELIAANPNYAPIIVSDAQDFCIEGVLTGVFRVL